MICDLCSFERPYQMEHSGYLMDGNKDAILLQLEPKRYGYISSKF